MPQLKAVIDALGIKQLGAKPYLFPHEAALFAGHVCAMSGAGLNQCRGAMKVFGREVLFDLAATEQDPKLKARLERAKCSPAWLKRVLEISKAVGGAIELAHPDICRSDARSMLRLLHTLSAANRTGRDTTLGQHRSCKSARSLCEISLCCPPHAPSGCSCLLDNIILRKRMISHPSAPSRT